MWDTIKKDPLIKTIVVVLIGILAFGFAFNIMFGSGGSSMEEGSMMGVGYSLGNSLEYIIALLIKVVIIGLLIGAIVWIFHNIYETVTYMKENYKNNGSDKVPEPSKAITKECPDCKAKVKDSWKCCPYCGSDKAFVEVKHEEHQI